METNDLITGADGVTRCWWSASDPEYRRYHDEEWGFPASSNVRLYEKICLEGFQSGLSWITILRKRPAFREAFDGFDYVRVAQYTEADVERLLADASIVRHRKKIESTINNARRTIELLEEFHSLVAYVWQFEPPYAERPAAITRSALAEMTKPPAAARLAKDLKRRGWSYVGPTTAYAFMQSVGLVNDHLEGCDIRTRATDARVDFLRRNR